MTQEGLEKFIIKQGWSMFGIVPFEVARKNLEKHEKVFQKWIENGFGADMDYLKKMQKDRYHPERKLADVKSVIVLGANYYSGDNSRDNSEDNRPINGPNNSPFNCGKVARYARGRDYHKILKKKLIELSDFLKFENPQAETYVSVDSRPSVDRVLAECAGLGFFGKNTCIIDPSRESFFFIASVLTNLDLKPTEVRHMPNCGDCQKCINFCPTGALVAPGVLDARKCISYLTIENKGGIPENLRSKIGNRIFGCDACQEVCPFNVGRAHKQQITIDKLKLEYGKGDCLDLCEIFLIKSDDEFTKKFAGTPLMRAKRRGLLRNACVVAGNSGNTMLIPHLEQFIKSTSDEMLAEHATWAILKLKNLK